jgi:hypothetical protein
MGPNFPDLNPFRLLMSGRNLKGQNHFSFWSLQKLENRQPLISQNYIQSTIHQWKECLQARIEENGALFNSASK